MAPLNSYNPKIRNSKPEIDPAERLDLSGLTGLVAGRNKRG